MTLPGRPVLRLQGLLFLFVLMLGLGSVHTADTWTHLATGGWIHANGTLPAADPFSASATDAQWRAHDWLADLLFYRLHEAAGAWGVVALKAALLALAFALLLPLGAGDPLLSGGVLALAACGSWPGLTETPGAFDFLMTALLLRWLGKRRAFAPSLVWKVAAVSVAWANLHPAGAWIGTALCAVAAMGNALGAARAQQLGWLAVAGVPLLALLTNPHGAGAWTHEGFFKPEWPLGPDVNVYSLYLAAGAAAAWLCLQEDFILSVSAMLLAALSVLKPSFAPLYPLAAAPLITAGLAQFLEPREPNRKKTAGLALLLGLLGLSYAVNVTLSRGRARGFSTPRDGEGAVTFLEANQVSGKMFNDLASSPYLLWRAAKARPLFADKRPGLHEASTLDDARRWSERWAGLVAAYRFDYAVVDNDAGGYPARPIDEDPAWLLAYFDDASLVYLRKGGPNDRVLRQAAFRRLRPNRWTAPIDEAAFADEKAKAEAFEETSRALTYAPGSTAAALVRAYLLERAGQAQKAEAMRRLAKERGYFRPEHWLLDGVLLELKGGWREASRSYSRAALLGGRAREPLVASMADARLAALFGARGEFRKARRLARKALTLDPANAEAQEVLRKL